MLSKTENKNEVRVPLKQHCADHGQPERKKIKNDGWLLRGLHTYERQQIEKRRQQKRTDSQSTALHYIADGAPGKRLPTEQMM